MNFRRMIGFQLKSTKTNPLPRSLLVNAIIGKSKSLLGLEMEPFEEWRERKRILMENCFTFA